MRITTRIAAATLLAVIPLSGLCAQTKQAAAAAENSAVVNYNQLYESAVADFQAGRYLEADAKFIKVLRKYPRHVQSQRHRALVQRELRAKAAIPAMKTKLSKLVVEQVEFDEVTLSDLMEFVARKAKELSAGEVTPGLVIKGGDEVRDRTLTIRLASVPLDTLVDFAAKLTNTKVSYHPYAITISSLPTADELVAEEAKSIEQQEAKARAEEEAAASNRADPFGR